MNEQGNNYSYWSELMRRAVVAGVDVFDGGAHTVRRVQLGTQLEKDLEALSQLLARPLLEPCKKL